MRLFFTSDIQAVLLAEREIDIDSFEQLIETKNIKPLIEENSTVHITIVNVSIDFFELYCYSVFYNLKILKYLVIYIGTIENFVPWVLKNEFYLNFFTNNTNMNKMMMIDMTH